MQKPAPVYTLEFVLHPEHDTGYRHFEDAPAHPFDARATNVTRVNAWWLAEAALAAYWPPARAAEAFGSSGLTWEYLREASTDAYVAWTDDAVIVAFRGTQPDDWGDIAADINCVRVAWTRGHVHAGFRSALDAIWPAVADRLDRLAATRAVWFAGHSLGGAIAVLAADRYAGTQGVCTIGAPRVGDETFAAAFDARFGDRARRYVNHVDGVPRLPPAWLGYQHVAGGRFIAENGTISDRPSSSAYAPPTFGASGTFGEFVQQITDTIEGEIRRVPKLVLDHMPKAYAIWTWNDYDANG